MHYLIPEKIWQLIFPILKIFKNIYIKTEEKLRLFIESIYYISRSGCQWRLLPKHYGNWNSNYKRFKRWSDKGILHRISLEFKTKLNLNVNILMIDSTIVRAHACSSGFNECLGRSSGGLSTKIHVLVDSNGKPIKFILTEGQKADITQANNLTKKIKNFIVLADKGYDCNTFINILKEKNCIPVIPSRKNRIQPREFEKEIYKERNIIERFFGRMKHFRRVFSRFDKSANVFLSFLYFVSIFV